MPMIKTGENEYRVLLALAEKDRHFSELMNEVRKASLAKILKELGREGYVKRRVVDTAPPTTIYSLTELGKEFLRSKYATQFERAKTEVERWNLISKRSKSKA